MIDFALGLAEVNFLFDLSDGVDVELDAAAEAEHTADVSEATDVIGESDGVRRALGGNEALPNGPKQNPGSATRRCPGSCDGPLRAF